MEDEIKSLEEKLKRLKLEKQLSKLGGSIKKEEPKKEKKISEDSKIKAEIKELEEKRAGQKGLTGFIRKLAINKQINIRKKSINAPRQIMALKQGIEINKLKAEYNETKKKVNSSSKLFGETNQPIKFIDTKDIFG